MAPLRHRRLIGLGELNAAIGEQVAALNARPFRGEPASRADLFEELERAALRHRPRPHAGRPSGARRVDAVTDDRLSYFSPDTFIPEVAVPPPVV